MWRAVLVILLVGCSYYNNHDFIGGEYVGAPYVRNPLGEGVGIDTDPVIRFDAFDCATFVETVLAGGDKEKLTKIRYRDGFVDFTNRNHFIETDWLENNADMIENVSAKYASTAVRRVTIDKKKWFKKNHNIDTEFAKKTVSLEYIPYSHAKNIVVDKPVIVLFIAGPGRMPDKIGTDLAVRHMGFLLPDGRLRHASRVRGRVVDVDFNKYINQIMENKNNLGIMILEIKNEER